MEIMSKCSLRIFPISSLGCTSTATHWASCLPLRATITPAQAANQWWKWRRLRDSQSWPRSISTKATYFHREKSMFKKNGSTYGMIDYCFSCSKSSSHERRQFVQPQSIFAPVGYKVGRESKIFHAWKSGKKSIRLNPLKAGQFFLLRHWFSVRARKKLT